ncbi:MAG: hypothetical protein J6S13_02040 [Clostridia bacterium]|nr:hypothetical protein [Clostridia bacterium]
MAKTEIPILLICGAVDRYVPYSENGQPFYNKLKAAGGKIARVVKPYCDHHPHGLYDTTTVCNFVFSAYGLNNESGFYSEEISYNSAKVVVYGDSITRGTYTAIGEDCPNSVAIKEVACYRYGFRVINGENIGFDPTNTDFKAKHMVDGVHPDPEIQKMYGEYVTQELLKGDGVL